MRERVTAPAHDRRISLGGLVSAWIEHFAIHGPGDIVGEPVELDDEFFGFVLDAYALDRRGRRLYDSAVLSRAKGRAKSELAAFVAIAEARAPVRFAGFAGPGDRYIDGDFFYPYADGEAMGHPVRSPFIRVLATEETQAGNIYQTVYLNFSTEDCRLHLGGDAAGLTRIFLPEGEIRPSTAANASKDGGKESFVAFDELHLYQTAELRGMHATVRRNLAKRRAAEPWSLETSTMYVPGEDSIGERTHALAQKIAQGKIKRPRLLFDHRQAPDDIDLTDEKAILEGLREAYGDFASVMDLRRIVDEIWDPRNAPADSRRFFFNQATSALDAWVTHYQWAGIADPEKRVDPADEIVLSFDGSRRRQYAVTDSTAIIGQRVSDGHVFPIGIWEEPANPPPDWTIPAEKIDRVMRETLETFNVAALFADPSKWESWIAGWEKDYGADKRIRVRASRDHPFSWWANQSKQTAAAEALYTAILDGEISHSGDPVLTAHVLNARRRPNRYGVTFGKSTPESADKVDGLQATVLANRARTEVLALPPAKKRSGKVW